MYTCTYMCVYACVLVHAVARAAGEDVVSCVRTVQKLPPAPTQHLTMLQRIRPQPPPLDPASEIVVVPIVRRTGLHFTLEFVAPHMCPNLFHRFYCAVRT